MEPPGTAPGSDPLMTSAFMSIVPKDRSEITGGAGCFKYSGRARLTDLPRLPRKRFKISSALIILSQEGQQMIPRFEKSQIMLP